jgi:hypothetical protein
MGSAPEVIAFIGVSATPGSTGGFFGGVFRAVVLRGAAALVEFVGADGRGVRAPALFAGADVAAAAGFLRAAAVFAAVGFAAEADAVPAGFRGGVGFLGAAVPAFLAAVVGLTGVAAGFLTAAVGLGTAAAGFLAAVVGLTGVAAGFLGVVAALRGGGVVAADAGAGASPVASVSEVFSTIQTYQ